VLKRDEVRGLLPYKVQSQFDDIALGRVLGASRHIRMIGDMFTAVGREELPDEEKLKRCLLVGDYFKETRGKSSYAIINAINLMLGPLCKNSEVKDTGECIENSIKEYFESSKKDTQRIISCFKNIVDRKHIKTLMVYDYSSTVEKCVAALETPVEVYIPESRVIDGGKPFVKPFVTAGHKVHFIADAAMLTVIRKIDAVLIGAETFYPDGSAFNTVGSDLLAEISDLYDVPYYVLTPFLKVDMRFCQGVFKEVIEADLAQRLAEGWEESIKEKVDFHSLELVRIPPRHIEGFVTEQGLIPAAAMFQAALAYEEKVSLGGRKK